MKVLISGYYGFGNAGDELILGSMISDIRSRRPDAAVTVLSADPRSTATTFNVRTVNRWNPALVFRELAVCDILVTGGGGLFQDDTGNMSLYYYLSLIETARRLRKKVFVYAAGVNVLKEGHRRLAARVLDRVDGISVREIFSFELLRDWGVSPDRMEVTADPVFLREAQPRTLNEREPLIGLVPRPPRRGESPVAALAALADTVAERTGASICLLPFQPETDIEFSRALLGTLRAPARLVAWRTSEQLFAAFGGLDMVISQRLHGLIIASLYGIPLLGISEDPKIHRFLEELGQTGITSLPAGRPETNPAFEVWQRRREFCANCRRIVPSFRLRARRNTDLLFSRAGIEQKTA